MNSLDCPCCGGIAREPDLDGYTDGDELECGCSGFVSVDAESDPYVWIDDACACEGSQ